MRPLGALPTAVRARSPLEMRGQAEVSGPVMELVNDFIYQSFFDSTLLQNALVQQNPNEPIVKSTRKDELVKGYGLVVAPWSESPVSIDFRLDGGPVVIAKPGMVVRPVGYTPDRPTFFQGFSWGLPYGWLGGGVSTIFVLQAPNSEVWAPGNPEIIFHRARFAINIATDLNAGNVNNAPLNWPRRFPWINAIRKVGASTIAQKGTPVLSITDCDRVQLVLRKGTMATYPPVASVNVRIIYQSTTDLDMTSTGTFGATNPTFEDITLPTWGQLGTSGNLATQNAAIWITPSSPSGIGLLRDNGDQGGIVFLDTSPGTVLQNGFLDVVRYGRL